MNDTLTITQARAKLLDLADDLAHSKGEKALAVTKRGKPVLAIVLWDLYESILETLDVMGDPKLAADLRKSVQQAKEGKTIPWSKAKRDLGL